MNDILISLFLIVSLLINLSSLDDIFIDLLSFGIVHFPFRRGAARPAVLPNIAIFVANWGEEDVLGKMVEGNLARIDIPEVSIFLGVYPNDTGTRGVAEALAAAHPDRVRVIVNSLPGPTSKGQMLNEMFAQSFAGDDAPDLVVLHDSEDVIDPRSFEIYARYARANTISSRFRSSRSRAAEGPMSHRPTWRSSPNATPVNSSCATRSVPRSLPPGSAPA